MDIEEESSYSYYNDSIIQNKDEEQIQHEDHEDAQHSEAEIDKLSRRLSIKLSESVKISEVWQHFTKDVNFKQNKKLLAIIVILLIHVLEVAHLI